MLAGTGGAAETIKDIHMSLFFDYQSVSTPTGWKLRALSRPVTTIRELYDMLHELRTTPRYALSDLEGGYFIMESRGIVESIWALARHLAHAHPTLAAVIPQMPTPRRYLHDELFGKTIWGFNAAETLGVIDLLLKCVARHLAAVASGPVQVAPSPAVAVQAATSTPSPAPLRPAGWPDKKCPVDAAGQSITIYGQPVRIRGDQQRQFVNHLRRKFPTGATKGEFEKAGIDYPHRVITTLHKDPLWKAVLERPGVGWAGGYRIVHAA